MKYKGILCVLVIYLSVVVSEENETYVDNNITTTNTTDNIGDLTAFLPFLQNLPNQIPSILLELLKLQAANNVCYQDLIHVLEGLEKLELWALEMIDTSGKIPSNILQGTFTFIGSYPQCRNIRHVVQQSGYHEHEIQGAYAKVSLEIPPNITEMLPKSMMFGPPSLRWDFCVPRSCSPEDLTNLINFLPLQRIGSSVQGVKFSQPHYIDGDVAAIVSIVILSVLALLCVVGTLVDLVQTRYIIQPKSGDKFNYSMGKICNGVEQSNGYKVSIIKNELGGTGDRDVEDGGTDNPAMDDDTKNDLPSKENGLKCSTNGNLPKVYDSNMAKKQENCICTKLLLAFSLNRNAQKILNCSSPSGTLGCLHGIRVLSMAWVILGHYILQNINIIGNKKDYFARINTFIFQFILNGTLSVDSFFLMSGLLVCYLFMREVGKAGRVTGKTMGLFYFHRYWRLTPLYMLVIMFYTNLTPYLYEGPNNYPDLVDSASQSCRDNWWTNLLYINNLYKSDQTEMCLAWSWYLANDMQFYVISPIALIPLALGYRVIGFLVLISLFATHLIASGLIAKSINFNGFLQQSLSTGYFDKVYIKPYNRVGVYAIGLALGYILYKTKGKKKLPKWLLFGGSVVAALFGLLSTYLTYDTYKINGHQWTSEAFVSHETLFRPAFAFALAWMICLCENGYGGVINNILSWNAWIPLSRLTYGAYLLHLIIMSVESSNVMSLVYFDIYAMINGFIGVFALTYAASFIAALLVESPCLGLEKVFIKK